MQVIEKNEVVNFRLNTLTATVFPLLETFHEIFLLKNIKNLRHICQIVFKSLLLK